VVADQLSPEWIPYGALNLHAVPVQYGCLGGRVTLLHRALHRAAAVAPNSQIIVTALDEYRDAWEPIVWCVRPGLRFIGNLNTNPLLTSAAAILSIAKASPSSIVTILPARCYVGHEAILHEAMLEAVSELPSMGCLRGCKLAGRDARLLLARRLLAKCFVGRGGRPRCSLVFRDDRRCPVGRGVLRLQAQVDQTAESDQPDHYDQQSACEDVHSQILRRSWPPHRHPCRNPMLMAL